VTTTLCCTKQGWPAAAQEIAGRTVNDSAASYSSGLWELFHMLSVSRAPRALPAAALAEAVRTFVDAFFNCEQCRRHFLSAYDACDSGACALTDSAVFASTAAVTAAAASGKTSSSSTGAYYKGREGAAMWLWRAHNSVNMRLAHERGVEVSNVMRTLYHRLVCIILGANCQCGELLAARHANHM
jgi:Erv1 / Alr family